MANSGFHVLYNENSIVPVICKRNDWKSCPEHRGLSDKRPNIKPEWMNKKELKRRNVEIQDDNVVTLNQYNSGFSVQSIVEEAESRKGSELTDAETQVAAVIGQWYEDGDIRQQRSFGLVGDYNIGFTTEDTIQKGDKTIGVVQIGSEGFKYFYEVENGEVTFKHADGYKKGSGKLPFNYGMRPKLTGWEIDKNNTKWSIEAYTNAHGL